MLTRSSPFSISPAQLRAMGEVAVTVAQRAGSGTNFRHDPAPSFKSHLKEDKVRKHEDKVEIGEDIAYSTSG